MKPGDRIEVYEQLCSGYQMCEFKGKWPTAHKMLSDGQIHYFWELKPIGCLIIKDVKK